MSERPSFWVALAALCMLGPLLARCSPKDGDSAGARLRSETIGAGVYQENCSACHDAENLELVKKPPKLKGLFQMKTLPSGAPATDAEVRKAILDGRGIMPPFKQTLDSEQLKDLLNYLHTL